MAHAVFWFWWRGHWACRLAMLLPIWATLIVWRLQDEPAHATGFHWLYIIAELFAAAALAWLIAGLPMYLRAAYSMARRARCLLVEGPDQRSAGSTVLRVPLAAVSAPRRLSLSD